MVFGNHSTRRLKLDKKKKKTEKARFCKDKYPVCVKARNKGRGILYQLVRLERHVCPYCRAYERMYGIPAYR